MIDLATAFNIFSCISLPVHLCASGYVTSHESSYNSTIRFEAILPNASFHIQQVRTMPVLSTPLSMKIARRPSSGTHTGGPPQVGYVTLNQTRKIVPLLENDPAVCVIPIVGVWTAFDEPPKGITEINSSCSSSNSLSQTQNSDKYDNENRSLERASESCNIMNPLTWAILTRFLFNEHIKERVYVADETFLLVCIQPLFFVFFCYISFFFDWKYRFCFADLLYCAVLHCTLLCSVVLCCTAVCSHTAWYCTLLKCFTFCNVVLYCTLLYSTVLHCTTLYCTLLNFSEFYFVLLYSTVPHCTVLYQNVKYYFLLC
jgi:SCL-interrupting locus protein N-terminus